MNVQGFDTTFEPMGNNVWMAEWDGNLFGFRRDGSYGNNVALWTIVELADEAGTVDYRYGSVKDSYRPQRRLIEFAIAQREFRLLEERVDG